MSFPDINSIQDVKVKWHPDSVFADHTDIVPEVEEGDIEEAERNKRMYEYARASQQDWNEKFQECEEYRLGAHWKPEQRQALLDRGQQPVVIQATYQLIEQLVDSMTANTPAFRATPVEDSDVALADAWSDLMAHMWYVSDGQMGLRDWIRDSATGGNGVAFAYIDPNADFGRGEVKYRVLDPKQVFVDPASTHHLADDASFIIIRSVLTYNQLRDIAGEKIAAKIRESKSGIVHGSEVGFSSVKEGEHKEVVHPDDIPGGQRRDKYEVLERYEPARVPYVRMYNPTKGTDETFPQDKLEEKMADPAYIIQYVGGVIQVTTDEREVGQLQAIFDRLGAEHHVRVDPMTGEREQVPGPPSPGDESVDPKSHTILTPTYRGELIELGLLPKPAVYKETRIRLVMSCGKHLLTPPSQLQISHYPAVMMHASRNRSCYPVSDVTRVRDLQDVINKSLSLILAHAANSTNMKVFYPDGSIVDVDQYEQQWGKAGTAFIPYDATFNNNAGPGGIVIAAPPPLPAALYANMDRAYQLMERVLGVYAGQQGEAAQAPPTFRGILMMDEMGNRRAKGRMDTVYSSLARLGNVMAQLAQSHYTEEKVIRLLQPSGDVKESYINYDDVSELGRKMNDITSGAVDMRVLGGSTLFNNRFAKQQADMEMFDRGVIDDVALLKHSEYPDANEILERKGVQAQLRQALEQYQEELKKAQGDMQTLEREVKNKAVRIEVEKAKSRLDSLLSKVESDARVMMVKEQETNKRAEVVARERLRAMDKELKQRQKQQDDGNNESRHRTQRSG